MILEIQKLIARAEYSGDFSFEYTPPEGSLLIPMCGVEGNVKVCASYEIFDDDSVEVKLKLSYKLVGSCSYCLSDASEDIVYQCEAVFVADKAKEDEYTYDGYKLDLTVALNDAFMISQPKVLLCRQDCNGIKLS